MKMYKLKCGNQWIKIKRDCFHNLHHILIDDYDDATIFDEVLLDAEINLGRLDDFNYVKIEL